MSRCILFSVCVCFSISSDPLVKQSDRKCIRILIDKSAFLAIRKFCWFFFFVLSSFYLSRLFYVWFLLYIPFFEIVHLTCVLFHVFSTWLPLFTHTRVIIFASFILRFYFCFVVLFFSLSLSICINTGNVKCACAYFKLHYCFSVGSVFIFVPNK